ncbi:Alpha/Beta hydrolase protein [Cadophora sp. MPI-SDFR-AT-0126]|nr:Alpha/Beta hydrolase protein [Leotiomycetes sp. MPI-SDFR-AT-0126]
MFPWRVGVPYNATSGLEKWEAPDPADWCARGYVIVNVDARGSFKSEGDFFVYGTQEGRDGYDTIEWIASQPWSNGSVGLAGNSWLGTSQWFIAAEQPPHLKAIAPWEGLGDYYRESICRGGIPDSSFWEALFQFFGGENQREDVATMVKKYPLWNAYWDDKRPKLGNIKVPMYATASYSTGLHTEGSLRGYYLSASTEKWLRVTHTQEWHDQYQPENVDDLQKFFDRYLKGAKNGWEATPKVRVALLGYNLPCIVNRPSEVYPEDKFLLTTFHLDAANYKLSTVPLTEQNSATYHAEDKKDPGVTFTYTFDRYTELSGFSKVILFMSSKDHDDMDVYVVVRKEDKDGYPLYHYNIPFADLSEGTTPEDIPHQNIFKYVGPNGRIRASHRAVSLEPGLTDEQRGSLTEGYVWHAHDEEEKIAPGEVVELTIGLWATGMVFAAGESMRLEVKGSLPIVPEFEGLDDAMVNHNVGMHSVHTGGKYDSVLKVYLAQEKD